MIAPPLRTQFKNIQISHTFEYLGRIFKKVSDTDAELVIPKVNYKFNSELKVAKRKDNV